MHRGGHQSDPCPVTIFDLLCIPSAHSFSSPALWTRRRGRSKCWIDSRSALEFDEL